MTTKKPTLFELNKAMIPLNTVFDKKTSTDTPQPAAVVGSIILYGKDSPPTGYLECDGAAISRTTYAALFAAIGTTYGAGDKSTTFQLPDLRGEFVRGWDHGRKIDDNRAFGSWQQGSLFDKWVYTGPSSVLQVRIQNTDTVTVASTPGARRHDPSLANTHPYDITPMYPVRPRNVSLLYCIKY